MARGEGGGIFEGKLNRYPGRGIAIIFARRVAFKLSQLLRPKERASASEEFILKM